MAKRSGKNESTQPLSQSQIMSAVPPKHPASAIPPNDRSVWRNVVVGADDFAPTKPQRRSRAGLAVLLGVLGAGAAVGIFFALTTTSSEPAKPSAADPAAVSPAVPDAAAAMAAPPRVDAAVVVDAAVDAPVDAPTDAAVPAAVPIDAGAVPATKPPIKKPVGKKKLPPKPKRKLH